MKKKLSITSLEFSIFLESYQTHIKDLYGISASILPSTNLTEFSGIFLFFLFMLSNLYFFKKIFF